MKNKSSNTQSQTAMPKLKTKYQLIFNTMLALASILIVRSSYAADFKVIAGCKLADFVAGGNQVEIKTLSSSYTPKCIKVKLGTMVKIGASRHHPLSAMPDIGEAKNPFAANNPFTASETRVMDKAGMYGYFCEAHGDAKGGGMAGVILVEE